MTTRSATRRRILRHYRLVAWPAAVTLGAGLLTLGSSPFSPPSGSTSPLSVTQAWIHDLDDAPCGVAEASPVEATLDSAGPSVEVGDRAGDLYAFHLSDGSVPAGWSPSPPSATITSGQACGIDGNDGATTSAAVGTNGIRVAGNPPIDSTASVVPTAAGDDLYFDAGNAADPSEGGYYAYGPGGTPLWNTLATNPSTDPLPDIGVAGLADGGFRRRYPLRRRRVAGPTDRRLAGRRWHAARRVALLLGRQRVLHGGRRRSLRHRPRRDRRWRRVHGRLRLRAALPRRRPPADPQRPWWPDLRRRHQRGGRLVPRRRPDPSRWRTRHRHRHGNLLPGERRGHRQGVRHPAATRSGASTLDGATGGSPALADVQGNGRLAVVEGTDQDNGTGSVWALDAGTGAVIWKVPAIGGVIGSVTTADLSGDGYQDVIVPTTAGLEILDGQDRGRARPRGRRVG